MRNPQSEIKARRQLIFEVLSEAKQPLLAKQIGERIGMSTEQVAANLAYMRAAGVVTKRRINSGKVRRYGHRVFSDMIVYWTLAVKRDDLRRLRRGEYHVPVKMLALPRTNDMWTMIDDIQRQAQRYVGIGRM